MTDLGAVFDDHVRAEFVDRDLDATMETMTDDPYVNHVPVMTGEGSGGRRSRASTTATSSAGGRLTPRSSRSRAPPASTRSWTSSCCASRTTSRCLRSCPESRRPGRRVELAFAVVVGFRDGKITHEHIYWDQASLLAQVGLLDTEKLPVVGADHARKVLDPSLPANALIERAGLSGLLRHAVHAARAVAFSYGRHWGTQHAAAIAYRVLFSLVPFVALVVSIVDLVLPASRRERFLEWLFAEFPGTDLEQSVDQALAESSAAAPVVGLVSLALLLWGATGMMASLRHAFTAIWDLERPRGYFRGKLRDVALVGLAGAFLIAAFALSVTAQLVAETGTDVAAALGWESGGGALSTIGELASVLLAVTGASSWFTASCRPRPCNSRTCGRARSRQQSSLRSQPRASRSTPRGFADFNTAYGSLGTVFAFLLLVYMLAIVLLVGAETVAARSTAAVEADGGEGRWLGGRLITHTNGPGFRTKGRTRMALQINETAPDFEAETTEGRSASTSGSGTPGAILFSHPKDFTPVCTTELGYMAMIKPEFDRRGVKIIGLSVDSTGDHEGWARDIEETQGHAPNYPIIADANFIVSKLYGMLPGTSGRGRRTVRRWKTRRFATSS